jgi:hypothetical protein
VGDVISDLGQVAVRTGTAPWQRPTSTTRRRRISDEPAFLESFLENLLLALECVYGGIADEHPFASPPVVCAWAWWRLRVDRRDA